MWCCCTVGAVCVNYSADQGSSGERRSGLQGRPITQPEPLFEVIREHKQLLHYKGC